MQAPRSVLAIDATTSLCSVAWTDGAACIERVEDAGQRHSELVLGMVSSGDLTRWVSRGRENEIQQLVEFITGKPKVTSRENGTKI